jgi:hypothetical protein
MAEDEKTISGKFRYWKMILKEKVKIGLGKYDFSDFGNVQ